jgi:hypothetical protein
MPAIPQYNIHINCKKCGTVFLKQFKTGNICQTCQRIKRNECRHKNLYSKCRMCGVDKEANQAVYCTDCHREKYSGKYVKRDKSKPMANEFRSELEEVVQRIRYKQSSYIFSLYDVNDIINVWYKVFPGRTDVYEMYSSGEQIKKMWFDLVKLQEKNG